MLSTDIQASRLCKPFVNNSSSNLKLWNTQLFKMVQVRGLLPPLLHDMVSDMLPSIVTPETIAIDLNEKNKDFPASEKKLPCFF